MIQEHRSKFTYTTDQKWTVSLLKILDEANAPDYAFGQVVLEWARLASSGGYSFRPVGGHSRSKNVDALIKSVCNADKLLPFVHRIDVPEGTSDVVCFDFVSQLLSLLQNPSIMTAENLLLDVNDPLKQYESPNNVLGEAMSGYVYRKAYK